MPRRSFLILAASLVILLTSAAAMVVYDASQRDVIANGITVGGIDIGA